MKKPSFLFCALLLTLVTLAQPPQKMSYQTVIRNATDDLVSNTTVGMQISVLQGTSSGTAVYVETHAPMTNANGLASLEIGTGTPVTGNMEAIDWDSGPYFLKSEVDIAGGTNYTLSLVSELLSVPYALHAFSSGDGQWSTSGAGINTSNFVVGINSATPEHTLDVRSQSQAEPAGLNVSNDDKSRYVRLFCGSEAFPDPSMSWAPEHDLLFATFDDITLDFQEKMRISSDGSIIAPAMTNALIESGGDKALVTKEYLDNELNTSSATKTINLPASDFRPAYPDVSSFISMDGLIYCTLGPVVNTLLAPISLPQGSVITELKIHSSDFDNDNDLVFNLIAYSLNPGFDVPPSFDGVTTTGSSGYQELSIPLGDGLEMTTDRTLGLMVFPSSGSFWTNSNLGAYGLEITYIEN